MMTAMFFPKFHPITTVRILMTRHFARHVHSTGREVARKPDHEPEAEAEVPPVVTRRERRGVQGMKNNMRSGADTLGKYVTAVTIHDNNVVGNDRKSRRKDGFHYSSHNSSYGY